MNDQTLFHHDARDYQEAARAAVAHAEDKMHAMFAAGRANLPGFLEALDREALARTDSVIPARQLDFQVGLDDDDRGALRLRHSFDERIDYDVHPHALDQLLGRGAVTIPAKYGRDLVAGPGWQRELLAHNLREAYSRAEGKVLVRAVDEQARGVLSDRYAIMDTRPLLQAFAEETAKLGAVPVLTHRLEVKNAVKVVLPKVYAPLEFERICVGLQFSNSDYGAGALDIRMFVVRLWCTNFATMESDLRRVHLGSRLVEGIALSHETHAKVQDALISAIRDLVAGTITPEAIDAMMGSIKAANAKELQGRDAVLALLRKTFGQKQAAEILGVYSGADAPIEALPPGGTQYRLAQAVSWWGQKQEDTALRLDAEQAAGRLLLAAA